MNKDETLSHSTNKGEQARKLLSKSLRQERVEFEMNSIQWMSWIELGWNFQLENFY